MISSQVFDVRPSPDQATGLHQYSGSDLRVDPRFIKLMAAVNRKRYAYRLCARMGTIPTLIPAQRSAAAALDNTVRACAQCSRALARCFRQSDDISAPSWWATQRSPCDTPAAGHGLKRTCSDDSPLHLHLLTSTSNPLSSSHESLSLRHIFINMQYFVLIAALAATAAEARKITVVNKCTETIWPGMSVHSNPRATA
jgi:hypothetical protein